jgi:hypothetical protein
MERSVIRGGWQHREHIPDSTAFHPGYDTGLQNTSMYSALRASHRLFKFNPIEFSPDRSIRE